MDDMELIYAATTRCRCGAGLAHPLDTGQALELRAWVCSLLLKEDSLSLREHDVLPFSTYKVREETSINNRDGATTRPVGTVCRTVGKARCPKCETTWQSEPYSACGSSHHWFSGPCPNCGYAVGAAGTWRSDEGDPIEQRYTAVVLSEQQESRNGD